MFYLESFSIIFVWYVWMNRRHCMRECKNRLAPKLLMWCLNKTIAIWILFQSLQINITSQTKLIMPHILKIEYKISTNIVSVFACDFASAKNICNAFHLIHSIHSLKPLSDWTSNSGWRPDVIHCSSTVTGDLKGRGKRHPGVHSTNKGWTRGKIHPRVSRVCLARHPEDTSCFWRSESPRHAHGVCSGTGSISSVYQHSDLRALSMSLHRITACYDSFKCSKHKFKSINTKYVPNYFLG